MSHAISKPLYPPRLKPGANVGIVAPAAAFDRKKFDQGLAVLKAMGLEPVVPESLFEKERYLAGHDHHRAELINRFFQEDRIQAIICVRGGFGSMRILDKLDFEMIARHPKIVVGFSDISALLWSLYQRCHFVTLHGPTITTLGSADRVTRTAFYEALTTGDTKTLRASTPLTVRPGQATAPVAGGNLTTLCHLVGTPFHPLFKDHIVILEDRGEAPYRIDRMLGQMKMAGCFEKVAGLALGSFERCGTMEEVVTIITELFSEASFPILGGFEVGHGEHNLTLPLGAVATLDTHSGVLAYQRPATASIS